MRLKILTILIFIVALGAAGFFVYQHFFHSNLPEGKEGAGGISSEGTQEEGWRPTEAECRNPELQQKCDEYCSQHPDACPGWISPDKRGAFSGAQPLALPSKEEKASLMRNYPSTIKAINEGPAIYGTGPGTGGSITNENLEKIKDTGFNTVQLFIMPAQEDGKFYIDPYNESVLFNDIIKVKKSNLAAWVAFTYASGPAPEQKIGSYNKFKPAFLEFVKKISKELEEYKVEYITVHTEPDLIFQKQEWGGTEVKNNLIDFFPSGNIAARENFSGKIINKVTDLNYLSRNGEVLDAALEDVDIVAIDVGPPPNQMNLEIYRKEFDSYQKFASLTAEKNVPWMVGEYWMTDFFQAPSSYVKKNQVQLARASFDAYLKTLPKGAGYTWNDFSTFSLEPNGEATRLAIKDFFSKM